MIGIDLASIAQFVGLLLAALIAGMLKSYRDGRLGSALEAWTADAEQIEDIAETVENIDEGMNELCERVERVEQLFVVVHEDDPGVDQDKLREQVGVEDLPGDVTLNDD